MSLMNQYRESSPLGKVGFWGSLASILGLILAVVALFPISENHSAPSAEFSSHSLRFDGLYRSEKVGNAWTYLRFFPDGSVIYATSTGLPEQIAPWFNQDFQRYRGEYVVLGNRISFHVGGEAESTVSFRGSIEENGLVLSSHSSLNGNREPDRVFGFLRAPLEE